MLKSTKRILLVVALIAAVLVLAPTGLWLSLTHQPKFYAQLVATPSKDRAEESKHFEAQTLQLRNDIVNEPTWEALFTDKEVNAWLAEDLVNHFADQLPPEVHEPRVMFEKDLVTFAFKLDQGPVTSVVWIVARFSVPEDNVLSIAFEKIRAGALPLPASKFIEPLTAKAKSLGFDLKWTEEDGVPIASINYQSAKNVKAIILERIQVAKGQIRLTGRSIKAEGRVATPGLPDKQALQREFPKTKTQPGADPESPPSDVVRSEARPVR